MLWPPLLPRVPTELGETVQVMERQHEVIHGIKSEVAAELSTWRPYADAFGRDHGTSTP